MLEQVFKKLLWSRGRPDDKEEHGPNRRMNLEERKAWRREVLYHSIREHMLALEVISSMYRFRVMNLDERHHRFIVMMEVTSLFEARRAGILLTLNEVEKHLQDRTLARYGVVLDKVYWRVDENASFYTGRKEERRAGDDGRIYMRMRDDAPKLSQAQIAAIDPGSIPDFDAAAEAYTSDLAPLEASPETGSTQYGKL